MTNDNEENFNEEISLQNYKYDDNIDLDGVDLVSWWKEIIILGHMSCIITFEFSQFEYVCYNL